MREIGLVSWLGKLLRPAEKRRTLGDQLHDREADARADLLDGKAMTPDGGFIDFESDSTPPRY